jgi:hypothetical protein
MSLLHLVEALSGNKAGRGTSHITLRLLRYSHTLPCDRGNQLPAVVCWLQRKAAGASPRDGADSAESWLKSAAALHSQSKSLQGPRLIAKTTR